MTTVVVVGRDHVCLPLAVEFGKKYRTIGFGISEDKIRAYSKGIDPTGENSDELPRAAAIVAAVAHRAFKERLLEHQLAGLAPNGVYIDVKNKADAAALCARGIDVWRL